MKPAAAAACAALLLGASGPAAAEGSGEDIVEALMQGWAGAYDTAEQRVFDRGAVQAGSTARLYTLVAPVSLPWLGAHVLYLEESPHDDPAHPRRQVLLRLSLDTQLRPGRVRVRQYTFRDPRQWRALASDAEALRQLRREDLGTLPGCDLLLARDGAQFIGGTLGRGCVTPSGDPERYVDYSLLVGEHLYWYRKRQFRFSDDNLAVESIGYDWAPLHQARLFACSLHWSAPEHPGQAVSLPPTGLSDQGLPVTVTAPGGGRFEVELRAGTVYTPNRGLLLMLSPAQAGAPMAFAWAGREARHIGVNLDGLTVRCGLLSPPAAS